MRRNSMLGKDMDNKKFGQLCGGDSVVSRNEESLLSETVHHYQDSGKTFRVGELLDEIHRDGFPRTERNRELTE
jgi:hypothetical protein